MNVICGGLTMHTQDQLEQAIVQKIGMLQEVQGSWLRWERTNKEYWDEVVRSDMLHCGMTEFKP